MDYDFELEKRYHPENFARSEDEFIDELAEQDRLESQEHATDETPSLKGGEKNE